MLPKPRLYGIRVSPSDMNVSHASRPMLQVSIRRSWELDEEHKWGSMVGGIGY